MCEMSAQVPVTFQSVLFMHDNIREVNTLHTAKSKLCIDHDTSHTTRRRHSYES